MNKNKEIRYTRDSHLYTYLPTYLPGYEPGGRMRCAIMSMSSVSASLTRPW